MARKKNDILTSNYFLNKLEAYLQDSLPYVPDAEKENGMLLLEEINKYQEIEELKGQRELYYQFYVKNRSSNPVDANTAYKNYIQIKEKLEQMQGQNSFV